MRHSSLPHSSGSGRHVSGQRSFADQLYARTVNDFGLFMNRKGLPMRRSLAPVLILSGLFGCGGGGSVAPLPKTEEVSGTVTLKGQPLEGATVTFIPTGTTKGIECVGRTDESGVYFPKQIRGGEGVPAGTYKVVISRFLRNGEPVSAEDDPGNGGIASESLPAKYSNATATKLKAKVSEGGDSIDFDLE